MKPPPEDDQHPNGQEQREGLSAAFCEHAFEIAQQRAHHYGFFAEEGEEIANAFVAHILEDPDTFFRHPLQGNALEDWLFRCANNWVINAYQERKRQGLRETSLMRASSEKETPSAWEIPDAQPSPDIEMIRAELRRQVRTALVLLPARQKALYVAFYEQEQSIAELARSSHRNAHSVSQALLDLRQRMRKLLESGGLNQQEARDYLYWLLQG